MGVKPVSMSWHGFEALALENENMRVIVVPETGGRIVSVYDKLHAHEWLVSPENSHPYRAMDYGSDFNSLTPGGWDEMFPTILAGEYPIPGMYHGVRLPDHGEVWTLPWTLENFTNEVIEISVNGKALPYRLVRSLSLSPAQTLSMHYELTNNGIETLHYLWAAHPQFASRPGTKIILPEEVIEVINVLPLDWGEEWGPPGMHNAWPVKTTLDGKSLSQQDVGSTALHRGRKFYILPDQPIGWAGLSDPYDGSSLYLEWSSSAIPYCGIWIDEGALNSVASVAIEPTTGFYDAITLAWDNQRLTNLQPGATQTWDLVVSLNKA